MTDELAKLLLQAGIDTLLAVTMLIMVYFLSRGRGKATSDETETSRRREENDGKLIDAISMNAETQSGMKDLLAKAVDLQASSVEWHKRHDSSLDALRTDVKTRSELDGEAIEDFREDVKTRHEISLARFDSIEIVLQDIKLKVEKLPETVDAAKKEILAEIAKCQEAKPNTVTVNVDHPPAVILPQATVTADAEAGDGKAAA